MRSPQQSLLFSRVRRRERVLVGPDAAATRTLVEAVMPLMTVYLGMLGSPATLQTGLMLDLMVMLKPIFLVDFAAVGFVVGLMTMRHH